MGWRCCVPALCGRFGVQDDRPIERRPERALPVALPGVRAAVHGASGHDVRGQRDRVAQVVPRAMGGDPDSQRDDALAVGEGVADHAEVRGVDAAAVFGGAGGRASRGRRFSWAKGECRTPRRGEAECAVGVDGGGRVCRRLGATVGNDGSDVGVGAVRRGRAGRYSFVGVADAEDAVDESSADGAGADRGFERFAGGGPGVW